VTNIKRHERNSRLSRAVIYAGIAYFSGLTADDRSGDLRAQTREILAKADALFKEVGASRASILNSMIFMREIENFQEMNAVWEQWIDRDRPPARATVECRLAAADVAIEIQFTAAVVELNSGA
jgi:enamine deaminase RidA (YjgF/YER057c/UK114 family)